MHSIHSWKILMASSVWSHRWDFGLVPERIAFTSLWPQHIVHWPSLSSFKFQRDCFSLKDIDCKMSFCSIVLCCKFSCTPIHTQMNLGLKKSLIWDKYIFIRARIFSCLVGQWGGPRRVISNYEIRHNIKGFMQVNIKQGCALAEPSVPWRPTFALGCLGNLPFFIQIIFWAP